VFFDWDRADVTPVGMEILRQAANAYKAGGSVRIQVNGYTDLSGSRGYNQRLSAMRASNVADVLAKLGVARNDMTVSGNGERDPRVPTAPGVREPQNRRVEIVFP
jgi:outer membrane protein OmpA-like peptidoglycan-associated protein